jgi:hypothetical protein
VEAILLFEFRARQLRAHRFDVSRREAEGLEVREAPVDFAQLRRELDALAIRADRFVLPAGGLERVAIAHPDLGVVRILRQHARVQLDGLRVLTDARQDRRLQIAIARVAWIGPEQQIDFFQRLGRLALAVQDEGIVVSCGPKARCELQAAFEQRLCISVATQAGCDFRKHADSGDVGGLLLQMRAQQRFGLGDTALDERSRGFHQPRIASGCLDVLRAGVVCAPRIAHGRKVIGQRAPRIGVIGLQLHGAPERFDRCLSLCVTPVSKSQLKMCDRPGWMRRREAMQHGEGFRQVTARSVRCAEHQQRCRLLRHDFEDFPGLFCSRDGIGREQVRGVAQSHFKRAVWLRALVHRPIRNRLPRIVKHRPHEPFRELTLRHGWSGLPFGAPEHSK